MNKIYSTIVEVNTTSVAVLYSAHNKIFRADEYNKYDEQPAVGML